jgi:hypothetical protein
MRASTPLGLTLLLSVLATACGSGASLDSVPCTFTIAGDPAAGVVGFTRSCASVLPAIEQVGFDPLLGGNYGRIDLVTSGPPGTSSANLIFEHPLRLPDVYTSSTTPPGGGQATIGVGFFDSTGQIWALNQGQPTWELTIASRTPAALAACSSSPLALTECYLVHGTFHAVLVAALTGADGTVTLDVNF